MYHYLYLIELKKIAKLEFDSLAKTLLKKGLELNIYEDAIELLVENSFENGFGARPLKRKIKKEIGTNIANNILNNLYIHKKDVCIFVRDGEIVVD